MNRPEEAYNKKRWRVVDPKFVIGRLRRDAVGGGWGRDHALYWSCSLFLHPAHDFRLILKYPVDVAFDTVIYQALSGV